ncbi:MAG: hypothetical protein Q9188_001726 [Gyalolechia gomerana]
MKTVRKLQILGAFALGGIVTIFGAIRCYYVGKADTVDPSWTASDGAIWSQVEISVGIISACLPVYRPLLKQSKRRRPLAADYSTNGRSGKMTPTEMSANLVGDQLRFGTIRAYPPTEPRGYICASIGVESKGFSILAIIFGLTAVDEEVAAHPDAARQPPPFASALCPTPSGLASAGCDPVKLDQKTVRKLFLEVATCLRTMKLPYCLNRSYIPIASTDDDDQHAKHLQQRCGYTGHLVYWDWTLDWENITLSPVWDESVGFGGNGNRSLGDPVFKAHCVDQGPFAKLEVPYFEDIYKPHCLLRGFESGESLAELGAEFKPEALDRLLLTNDYNAFNLGLENGPHIAIPKSINGDFSLHTAPFGKLSKKLRLLLKVFIGQILYFSSITPNLTVCGRNGNEEVGDIHWSIRERQPPTRATARLSPTFSLWVD